MSLIDKQPPDVNATQPADSHRLARQRAIRQIERQRHFHIEVVVGALGVILLVVIWATSEYHNAGGRPMQGFSQSSGIHDVWNFWIIPTDRLGAVHHGAGAGGVRAQADLRE